MKLCINCYTENPIDAALCSKCGMSLTRAPTGEEALTLKEEATKLEEEPSRPQPEQPTSMFNIWVRAITRPVLATYEALLQEEPNPTLNKAVGWIAIAGVLGGVISGFLNLVFEMAQGESGGTLLLVWIFMVILAPIVAIISFVISSAILLAIARALGGEGDLGTQSYLLAAALSPLSIISGSLAAIPSIGVVLAWLAIIYGVYLHVLALRAAHRFGWGKAVGTVLIFAIVLGGVYCICVILGIGVVLLLSG